MLLFGPIFGGELQSVASPWPIRLERCMQLFPGGGLFGDASLLRGGFVVDGMGVCDVNWKWGISNWCANGDISISVWDEEHLDKNLAKNPIDLA